MSKKFSTIGLIGRQGMRDVSDTLNAVLDYLQAKKLQVLVEEETAKSLSGRKCICFSKSDLDKKKVDLLIVVGGDGSLINAAHSAVQHGIPVLGINRGRLGFLTDVHPQDLENKIGEVLAGDYHEEKRFLLNATIALDDNKTRAGIALNEVVLMPGNVARMIEFSITIDDQFVCVQQADGLIVSTPTGSTAYSLSGGGAILHPQLNAIVLVPMFPHTLSARPIVVSADSQIDIHIHTHSLSPPSLSCDGRARISVPIGADIHIQKNSKALRLIHPRDYNYFETLRTKLHWNKNNHIK
ncbi:probable inorganic polyphosphate/ATP-NAD kinase [Candidatus Rickettsiella viridis]|uniref:NAD kinase n=1 Tax=Candidatus Rickettsiella viridis TaxID=676208 RepID=A0A2Z5UWZ9_9COXI|nr:NAD(+) kinase [Candidatus Rickettsiella viridis]BBB15621.1 probable inorganic polyphosphate/ATP-NAD kinase [Candidatus Rickettsiella viridis]